MLRTVVDDALLAVNCNSSQVVAVCLGLAGVDTPRDVELVTARVRPWFPEGTTVLVYNDAVTALAAGTAGSLYGCVVIAGTGDTIHRAL